MSPRNAHVIPMVDATPGETRLYKHQDKDEWYLEFYAVTDTSGEPVKVRFGFDEKAATLLAFLLMNYKCTCGHPAETHDARTSWNEHARVVGCEVYRCGCKTFQPPDGVRPAGVLRL